MQFVSLIRPTTPFFWLDANQEEGWMIAERVAIAPRAFVTTGWPRRWSSNERQRFGRWLARMLRNYRTRRYLTEIDDHMLADLGISRAQAEFEASRWMWDGV